MDRLILFSKFPTPGFTKTRLGKSIGMEKAAAYHRQFLDKLIAEHKDQEYEFFLSTPTEEEKKLFEELYDVTILTQEGDELGERMHHAFKEHLPQADKVMLIGADLPDLSADDVSRAFSSLDNADLVLGPAVDGGYYLIAMKEPIDVFSDIVFSHPTVLKVTMRRAMSLGKSFSLLKRRRDIDTEEDLRDYLGNGA